MSMILHAVYASPIGPQPIDYLINLPGGFYLPLPIPMPPVIIPTTIVVPPVQTGGNVPEPATLALTGIAVLAVCILRAVVSHNGRDSSE